MPKEYDANNLLDTLIKDMGLKNDAALAQAIQATPPQISNIRNNRLPIGASLLIRMHDASGKSIKELRQAMGDSRPHFGPSTLELMAA